MWGLRAVGWGVQLPIIGDMHIRLRIGQAGLLVFGVVALGGLGACTSSEFIGDPLRSNNPLDRAQAAVRITEEGKPSAVPKLVGLLDDYDQGVRMYAILGLRKLCGEDLGYRYYDPEPDRAEAVRRWRDALRAGEVTLRRSGDASASAERVPVGES